MARNGSRDARVGRVFVTYQLLGRVREVPLAGAGRLRRDLALGPALGILANALIYQPLVLWLWRAPYGPRFRKDY